MLSKRLKTYYLKSYEQFFVRRIYYRIFDQKNGPENAILASERALTAVIWGYGGYPYLLIIMWCQMFEDIVASVAPNYDLVQTLQHILENLKRFG